MSLIRARKNKQILFIDYFQRILIRKNQKLLARENISKKLSVFTGLV